MAHGVYRLSRFPAQRFEDLVLACLWAGPDAFASYEMALIVYDISDAMPATVHLTLPHRFRGRRPGVTVHHAPLDDGERTVRDAVPVTSVERTLVDVASRSDPDLAVRAAQAALAAGLTTPTQGWGAELLRGALLSALSGGKLIGARVMLVDAISDQACAFYVRFGPTPSPIHPPQVLYDLRVVKASAGR